MTSFTATAPTLSLGHHAIHSDSLLVALKAWLSTAFIKFSFRGTSFANTTKLCDSLANATTNRFRFEYRAATFNETERNLPLGEIQVVAWQHSTCVQMHVAWLLLPKCLTALTTVLMTWTDGANWKNRRGRPVWKGKSVAMDLLLQMTGSKEGRRGEVGEMASDKRLMEVSEMSEIGKIRLVTFAFPDKDIGDRDPRPPGRVKKHGGGWFRWRGRGRKEADALLGSAQK